MNVTWLSVYPVVEEAAKWSAEKGLFINIGGGIGHQCAQFKEKYPSLQGRIVLQDLPHSVAQALPTPGVENMAHDMFERQPILGAKFYHLRGVLHNQSPLKVQQLLENIKAAMGSDSILLVDELVLPNSRVNYIAASIDMTMLSAFASMERTEAQWRETFEHVGLELVHTYTYYPQGYESVMDVRLPRTQIASHDR
ncbi:putative Sterigmatocystin 8-O-methyltransferase [Glarea lozoyensis 74030]|uniref:Putative Sterigmatocystin 8-O-methyltransferase n=1 Tax=Glarea lozoyensis (strain ATCC 74030 / MF5533) TaxID=1104152 RepID=H0EHS2_GLAL7|nr:putative Sterigmatocystin 8-O-methyltransferase [Glarea lozoyensis 74030]